MVKVLVVFYSTYGHNYAMAKAAVEGAKKVPGVDVEIYQIKETLSDEILGKMHATEAKKAFAHIPVITPDILATADGVIFGLPTRIVVELTNVDVSYGNMSAQAKTFFDSCGQLWASNVTVGKVASVWASSNSQHGGQESTILSTIPVLLHFGFVYVGAPYTIKEQTNDQEIIGGSPYGASTVAGNNGARQPTAIDLSIVTQQATHVAKVTAALVAGNKEHGF